MKKTIIAILIQIKGITLFLRPHVFMGWMRGGLFTVHNTLLLSKWIRQQEKNVLLNDFYSIKREHSKRYALYSSIVKEYKLENETINYLEFGVESGNSFKWWLGNSKNAQSRFWGFDTFEGLPEKWGVYEKGAMMSDIPLVNDNRAQFIKGLFQNTLPEFLKINNLNSNLRNIVHLDADLFSSTLFVLTSLAPYIKKGDILLFDEFNVPNHEFLAFKLFSDSFPIKTRLIGAVNNYYQIALLVE